MISKVFAVERCWLQESSVIGIISLDDPIESLVKVFTSYYEKEIEKLEESLNLYLNDPKWNEHSDIQDLKEEIQEFKKFLENVRAHCIVLYNEKIVHMDWKLHFYITEHVVN